MHNNTPNVIPASNTNPIICLVKSKLREECHCSLLKFLTRPSTRRKLMKVENGPKTMPTNASMRQYLIYSLKRTRSFISADGLLSRHPHENHDYDRYELYWRICTFDMFFRTIETSYQSIRFLLLFCHLLVQIDRFLPFALTVDHIYRLRNEH